MAPPTRLFRRLEIAKGPSHSEVVHRVSSSLLGPVLPSLQALSGRLKFTVQRHKSKKDSLSMAWLK